MWVNKKVEAYLDLITPDHDLALNQWADRQTDRQTTYRQTYRQTEIKVRHYLQ